MNTQPPCPACQSKYSYQDGIGTLKRKSELVNKA